MATAAAAGMTTRRWPRWFRQAVRAVPIASIPTRPAVQRCVHSMIMWYSARGIQPPRSPSSHSGHLSLHPYPLPLPRVNPPIATRTRVATSDILARRRVDSMRASLRTCLNLSDRRYREHSRDADDPARDGYGCASRRKIPEFRNEQFQLSPVGSTVSSSGCSGP